MTEAARLLAAYRQRGVVVDSNLLLLLFLGLYRPALIESYKRLAKYTNADFGILSETLAHFQRVITTPHILTEVSNLSNAIPTGEHADYFVSFAKSLSMLQEESVPSIRAVANRFGRFGLTDSAIAEIAENRFLVLTDDFRLSQTLQSEGIPAVNFNHLRDEYWRSTEHES